MKTFEFMSQVAVHAKNYQDVDGIFVVGAA